MSVNENISNTIDGYLGSDYQKKIMWQVLTEPEFAEKIFPFLNSEYFDDHNYKKLFIVIHAYYSEHKKIPNLQNKSIYFAIKKYNAFGEIEKDILESVVENIRLWNERVLNKSLDYDGDIVQREAFNFIKQQEYRKLADYIHQSVKEGFIKYEKTITNIEEKIKIINQIGDDEDYGDDVSIDIESVMDDNYRVVTPTGIGVIDHVMEGGLGNGEIGIILAASGVGKTSILTKVANEAYDKGKNVLQIVFEDTKSQIKRKHFAIWSEVALSDMKDNEEYVLQKVKEYLNGRENKLIIKRFSQENVTIKDVKNYMDRYYKKFGIKFDMLVLDYIDCLESHIRTPDQNLNDLYIIKSFEALAAEYNIPAWSAIQGNRSSFNTDFLFASHMGGSIKRAQKTHFLMSVAKTPEQKEAGLANVLILKSRFSQDGQKFENAIFNNNTLEFRITDSYKIKKKNPQIPEIKGDEIEKLMQRVNKNTLQEVNDIINTPNEKEISDQLDGNKIEDLLSNYDNLNMND